MDADRNRVVVVPHTTTCGRTLSEDGILITSSHSPSERCTLTISNGVFSRKQLLVRFEQLSLPAQGAVQPTITMTCYGITCYSEPTIVIRQNTSGVIGKVFTFLSSMDMEFRNMQKSSDFRIVITRTEDDILCSGEHYCSTTHYCIDKDLRCDRIDHCGDNSDETHYSCIYDSDTQLTPIGVIIGGAVVAVIVVIAVGVTVAICRRRSMLRGFSSRRAPTLATQAPGHGQAPGGAVFMPVPQSDPMGAAQPYPYPQQPGHWQPPAAPGMAYQPPAYEDAMKSTQYPPVASMTYQYPGAPPAGYPVQGAYPQSAAGQPPYPSAGAPMPAAPYPAAPVSNPPYGNA